MMRKQYIIRYILGFTALIILMGTLDPANDFNSNIVIVQAFSSLVVFLICVTGTSHIKQAINNMFRR
jgi:hypothetical protein